jgi:hypothetical protein
MKVTAVGGKVAIVLDEELEQKLRLEGEVSIGEGKTLFLVREQKGTILPQMRVGKIISVGKGIWKKVDGSDRWIPMPESIKVGMTVGIPPFMLAPFFIEGVGNVVMVNPHSLMGLVTSRERRSNSGVV